MSAWLLLDVGNSSANPLCLVETDGLHGRYCVLSYSWRRYKSFRAHKATWQDRIRGFVLEDLPTTIRDAVCLTSSLGLRYLWVDACALFKTTKRTGPEILQ